MDGLVAGLYEIVPALQKVAAALTILALVVLGIGVITPPVGTVLYVVCGVGNIKITKLVQGMLPFLVTEIIMLFLLLFFPSLSLTPLNWLMGG